MDQDQLHEQENKCIQDCPPGCTSGCPVHVDARSMIASVQKSDFSNGFSLLRKSIPFPGIISRICSQPCRNYCIRKDIDDSISIRALEKICVDNNTKPVLKIINPPVKNQKVAVIGAGLSGLTAALELVQKGFNVVIYEAADCIGGRVRDISETILAVELIDKDFSVFDELPVIINFNTCIGSSTDSDISFKNIYKEYDAIYIGTGNKNVPDFQYMSEPQKKITINPQTLLTDIPKVFAGGSFRTGTEPWSAINSISDGKIAAASIDRFLQNASLTANRGKEGSSETSLYTNSEGIVVHPAAPMSDSAGYTISEALAEAERCILCECLECVKVCGYLAHYKSYPKKYVREIYNNLSIVMGLHRSNKMINSCSLCGLCAEVCPNNLNMGEICIEARRMLVAKGKMPPSTHDFAIRDMKFSNSDEFKLIRNQPGTSAGKTVFFPGCQLSASYPEYVTKLYRHLCDRIDGGVGLMLGCCGAPAGWAGQEKLFSETLSSFEQDWEKSGKPAVITACPSCFYMFKHGLPDIPVETAWTVLDRIGLPGNERLSGSPMKLAVHDSCTTRFEKEIHKSVRNIILKKGHQVEELPGNRERTVCCAYGGLMIYANREVADKVINKRVLESSTDYVSYCSMCRDNFANHGKRSYHILDLIFDNDGKDSAERESPGYSRRRENRSELKKILLTELWGEQVDDKIPEVKLIIPEKTYQIMEDRLILVSDVSAVISNAEKTGNKLKNKDNGHFIAYLQPLKVTYWVEYSSGDNGFTVHNAYSHRLEIKG